jgi:hypothetical protein
MAFEGSQIFGWKHHFMGLRLIALMQQHRKLKQNPENLCFCMSQFININV